MALVEYCISSDSNSDDDEDNSDSKVIINSPVDTVKDDVSAEPKTEPESELNTESESIAMFNSLPKPTTSKQEPIEDNKDEFLNKREVRTEKPRVRIEIPSIPVFDSDEEDEPEAKMARPTTKQCGLFALLPAPTTTPITNTSFLPRVLSKKPKPSSKSVLNPLAIAKKVVVKPSVMDGVMIELSDSDDDIQMPETYDEEAWQKACGRQTKRLPKEVLVKQPSTVAIQESQVNSAPEAVQPYGGLNNEAFKELVGTSKNMPRNINLIDIHEEDILPEKDLWLRKSLTDPEFDSKSKEDDDPIDGTSKRKHHITYLAQQAKANEKELQNQWAANRYSRKQTQAKYGF